MDRLLNETKRKEFDIILVWKMDRLARKQT
ncbi:recombinase family protein [Neobacillus cucumis]|nr:recombinase family protein [Neobacillus cucumis]